MSGVIAFILGWLASFCASILYSWGIRPKIDIKPEDSQKKDIGQRPGQPKHRFLHLIVENRQPYPPWRLISERQTAWSCEVILEIFSMADPNKKVIQDKIIARWSSAPELIQQALSPNVTINAQPALVTIPDISKLPYGRRLDLHGGTQETIALVVKIEGQRECYIFSNESYWLGWENQNWRLDEGEYLVKAQARSGSIRKSRTFKLINKGTTLEDVLVEAYDS